MKADSVIDFLSTAGFIDASQADDLRIDNANSGQDIAEELVNFGLFESPEQLYATVADQLAAEYIDLEDFEPPQALLAAVSAGMARLHGALPVSVDDRGISVALVDPLDPQIVEDLRFALGQDVVVVVADPNRITELIDKHYGIDSSGMEDVLSELGGASSSDELNAQELEAEANSAPIIRYVDLVLYQAIKERASDIHFEPFQDDFKIRYRVDGSLYEMAPPPAHLQVSITSRIKVMANLNIAERRLPQDGRIMKTISGQPIDLRVSTLPTVYGESVVLRVLDRSSVNLDLESLGMQADLYDYICDAIQKPNGIFIATGPTGAGKTTTLYAALRTINTIDS
ncbi:MAG: GspE/PulE family protein, partial [Verrucomicrobiales bacterium]